MTHLLHHVILEDWLAEHLPAALLISGPAGIGKGAFAEILARRLIGASDEAVVHPDLVVARPNELLKSRSIDVATIRALTGALALTATGPARVALILEADRMTEGAANALLKTLEEPPAGTTMILTAAEPWRLPATIRSRLATRRLPVPSIDDGLAFLNEELPDLKDADARALLQLANGAPLLALALSEKGPEIARGLAALAAGAAAGSFDRAGASDFSNKAGETGWETASRLVLRFLHLAGLAAGNQIPTTSADELKVLKAFAVKAGPFKIAEAWRIAAELKRSAEDQALAKSWQLYRMTLALEWACR